MTINGHTDALRELDFPTPVVLPGGVPLDDRPGFPLAAEYRPLHSGLLVPTSDQDTAPLTRISLSTGVHSVRRETALSHPAQSNGHLLTAPAPAAPPAPPAAPVSVAPPAPQYATPSGWQRLAAALAVRIAGERGDVARDSGRDRYVPGWTLWPLGAFTVGAAIAAFILSFQMIMPVVRAAGWTAGAWLGPIVIDLAAVAAAFMGVASRHPAFVRTGRFLLVTATGLSISLNLAGHQVVTPTGAVAAGPVLPPAWDWAVWLFSVTVPVILAVLIHVFGKALIAWTTQQAALKEADKKAKAKLAEEAQLAEEARLAAQRAQAAAAAPAPSTPEQVAAETTAPRPARPAPPDRRARHRTPGAKERKERALEIARAANATTPAAIRDALQAAGVAVPSQSTLENYAKELKQPQPST